MPRESLKRIVILGHNGFIGRPLFALFRSKRPDLETIGFSLPELDLTVVRQAESLRQFFDEKTAVIMCSGIKKQFGDSLDIFSQNLAMAVNVSKLIREQQPARFIFFSSAEVYGCQINNSQISEETPVNPDSYYGAAKYASECLLREVFKGSRNGSLVILRPPLVYGPHDTSAGYGPAGFIAQAKAQREVTFWGDGSEKRGLIFVEDLAKIVYELTFLDFSGVINTAGSTAHTFKEMLEAVLENLPYSVEVKERARTKEKADNIFRVDLLRGLLPDISFTSLKEGIRRILESEETAQLAV